MEKQQLRKIIGESPHTDWLRQQSTTIDFSHLGFDKNIKGFYNIYNFISDQLSKWNEISKDIPNELKSSITYYTAFKGYLDAYLNNYISNDSYGEGQLQSGWNDLERNVSRIGQKPLIFESVETKFLLDLYQKDELLFKGAFSYITNQISNNIINKDFFTGAILAYEFANKNLSEITSRKARERTSIKRITNKFQSQLQNSESQLINHLSEYNESYKKKSEEIQAFKDAKEKLFNEWFITSKGDFEEFDKKSKSAITELETIYEEKLRLKKPAKYWKERAKVLKKDGNYYINIMICLIIVVCISLYFLLVITPEGMLTSFQETGTAIKWSIVYIMFVSLLAYGIRVTHKIAFSAFHLARDAEEREQLAYFYLALLNETEINTDEKKLILQSLFSRADTGLLKDDSGPTMPNDFIGKFIK